MVQVDFKTKHRWEPNSSACLGAKFQMTALHPLPWCRWFPGPWVHEASPLDRGERTERSSDALSLPGTTLAGRHHPCHQRWGTGPRGLARKGWFALWGFSLSFQRGCSRCFGGCAQPTAEPPPGFAAARTAELIRM